MNSLTRFESNRGYVFLMEMYLIVFNFKVSYKKLSENARFYSKRIGLYKEYTLLYNSYM